MGTIKVSAFPAATSLQDSQEFLINESGVSKKISGLLVKRAVAIGRIAYAAVTANQTGVTAEVDATNLSATWTAVSTRYYRLTAYARLNTTTASTRAQLKITDSANTQVADAQTVCSDTTASSIAHAQVVLAGLSGSVTYKVRILLATGAGTMGLLAGATYPAFLLVEDIGA